MGSVDRSEKKSKARLLGFLASQQGITSTRYLESYAVLRGPRVFCWQLLVAPVSETNGSEAGDFDNSSWTNVGSSVTADCQRYLTDNTFKKQ